MVMITMLMLMLMMMMMAAQSTGRFQATIRFQDW
jgi:hypothetical protein